MIGQKHKDTLTCPFDHRGVTDSLVIVKMHISGMNLYFLNINPLEPRCNIRAWADYPQFHDRSFMQMP